METDKMDVKTSTSYSPADWEGDKQEDKNKLWIGGPFRRYMAVQEDFVIGIIVQRHGEGYRVDIGSSELAFLPTLSFEGATKRNKPNLLVGTVVFARLTEVDRDMEPELSCMDSVGRAAGFGELIGGTLVKTSLTASRKLLSSQDEVLKAIGAQIPFEVAVGLNGRIWIRSDTTRNTLTVAHALKALR